jgi:hypothetical protein
MPGSVCQRIAHQYLKKKNSIASQNNALVLRYDKPLLEVAL